MLATLTMSATALVLTICGKLIGGKILNIGLGRIKNVGTTLASQPQKKLRGLDIISGIRIKIQPNGSRICTLAKRSDGYAIKGTKSKGKTKSFYAHRLVRSHKLGLPVQPGYFTCHSWDDRGCVNSDHLWEGTPADKLPRCQAKKTAFLSFHLSTANSNPNRCGRFAIF